MPNPAIRNVPGDRVANAVAASIGAQPIKVTGKSAMLATAAETPARKIAREGQRFVCRAMVRAGYSLGPESVIRWPLMGLWRCSPESP